MRVSASSLPQPSVDTVRLAVLQRVCPPYRVALFTELSAQTQHCFRLFIGDDLPNTKVRSAADLSGIDVVRLRTTFLALPGRTLPWHHDLVARLREYRPDVVICEAESHLLGYLQALWYRFRFRDCALVYWCFVALPGRPRSRWKPAEVFKRLARRLFDGFLTYHSLGKAVLVADGHESCRVFVATNVGDTAKCRAAADALAATPAQARTILGLPADSPMVLYAGTLDSNKRPDVLVEAARDPRLQKMTFVIAGAGPLQGQLERRIAECGSRNVRLVGRVEQQMPLYFRAASVLAVPGRGGIVVSEAQASGLAVICHEADGTEGDLIVHGETGWITKTGEPAEFAAAFLEVAHDEAKWAEWGARAKQRLEGRFTTQSMAATIVACAEAVSAMNRAR